MCFIFYEKFIRKVSVNTWKDISSSGQKVFSHFIIDDNLSYMEIIQSDEIEYIL